MYMGKEPSLAELAEAALTMVQGSLSEVTRQCGDPSCACAWDPQRRHGPHLYLKFSADGKTIAYTPQPVAFRTIIAEKRLEEIKLLPAKV